MKLFVDLDRTLFNTDKFSNHIWEYIANNSELSFGKVKNEAQNKYNCGNGKLNYYDCFLHLKVIFKESYQNHLLELVKSMQSQNFLYEDALDFIANNQMKHDVSILTYGKEDFQKLKITITGLGNVNYQIVLAPKEDYLSKIKDEYILIDDKDYCSNLPGNSHFILIDRDKKHGNYQRKCQYVTNLDQANRIIDNLV